MEMKNPPYLASYELGSLRARSNVHFDITDSKET